MKQKDFQKQGVGTGHDGEHLAAGPLPMGSGCAQPEETTGDPPVGGAKGVWFTVTLAVQSPAAETRSRDVGHHLADGE